MKESKKKITLQAKRILTVLSSAALVSGGLTAANVTATSLVPSNIAFSEDTKWMKESTIMEGEIITVDFSSRFDGQASEVSGTSSNHNVATVSQNERKLQLIVKGFGETTVTVSGSDADGNLYRDTFTMNITKKGDLNGDGVITSTDALKIYQVVSGKLTLSPEQLKLLDLDGDGKVTNNDATVLLKNYVGKTLPTIISNNYFVQFADVNDIPVTKGDIYETNEDESLEVDSDNGVLKNDRDVENTGLKAMLVKGPEHGVLSLDEDGSFIYVPNQDYQGEDEFSYVADDDDKRSEPVKVKITVDGSNDAPVAVEDVYEVEEDGALTKNVTQNDTDVDGNALTVSLVSGPSHGTLVLVADGSFDYAPDGDYHGTDEFTYQVSDGHGNSNVVSAKITVKSVNDKPYGADESFETDEDQTLNVIASNGVLKNDTDMENDTLKAVLIQTTQHGSLTLEEDGSFTYVSDSNYHGTDTFTYKAVDGSLESEPVTVTINVKNLNDLPVAVDDNYTIEEDEGIITVGQAVLTANDTDADGDTLDTIKVSDPSHGSVTMNPGGGFEYQPSKDYHGTDSFTYKVTDGNGESNVATVTFMINSVDDRPEAKDLAITGTAEVDKTLTASYTYFDVEGDLESGTKYQWYRSDDADGTNMTPINGATGRSHTITMGDVGTYLSVRVTPRASSGEEYGFFVEKFTSAAIQPPDWTPPEANKLSPNGGFLPVASRTDDLEITFSEDIKKGSNGYIMINELTESGNEVSVHDYDINDPAITVDGNKVKIKHDEFKPDTQYEVFVGPNGAFEDIAGNAFGGIMGVEWTFRTISLPAVLTATPDVDPLTESYFRDTGIILSMTLQNDTWKDTVNKNDFVLNNAPHGTELYDVQPMGDDTVLLFMDGLYGMDYDVDVTNFTVTAKGSGLTKGKEVTSNPIAIKAEIEPPSVFISEYLVGSNDPAGQRTGIELFNAGPSQPSGYELMVTHFDPLTGGYSSNKFAIAPDIFWTNSTYNIIDPEFYDPFDKMSVSGFHEGDQQLYVQGKYLVGITLFRSGQVVDVVGGQNRTEPILPNGGTLVKKSGNPHGSKLYFPEQWNLYPRDTYQYFGKHTR
ncbi:Ig-like domain-containing protein [Peribacillus asahii]|uniref:Ig-like domain-containing protein n=1 Tax=Peribacillus asahii TaxID=228899 RepID=UPI003813559D